MGTTRRVKDDYGFGGSAPTRRASARRFNRAMDAYDRVIHGPSAPTARPGEFPHPPDDQYLPLLSRHVKIAPK